MKDLKGPKSRGNGFSLVEVLVAMMIMTGGIVVITNTWSGNYWRQEKARINSTTALLLQRKMTEVEVEFKEKPVNEIPEEQEGDFGATYPRFKWRLESKDFEMPNLSGALTAQEGGAGGELLMIVGQMTDVISKSVKEVTVSVIYTSNKSKKQLKNSVTTYFVDYSKDLPLGPGGLPADTGTLSGAQDAAGGGGTGSGGGTEQ